MKVFYDTEFIEDGKTIDLISIGMVTEEGYEYYAVNSEAPMGRIRKHDWLVRNVLPSLPVAGRRSLDYYLKSSLNVFPRPPIDLVDIDTEDIRVKPRQVIRNEVRDFLLASDGPPELWAWYGAYDHVVLAQLWGPMVNLPRGIPMWTRDLNEELVRHPDVEIPEQAAGQHNALEDARHIKKVYELLTGGGS